MARFIAEIEGSRGPASRLGTPASGIHAEARGWDVGVSIDGGAEGDDDVFYVYVNGGSNNHSPGRHIGTVRLVDGRPEFVRSNQP